MANSASRRSPGALPEMRPKLLASSTRPKLGSTSDADPVHHPERGRAPRSGGARAAGRRGPAPRSQAGGCAVIVERKGRRWVAGDGMCSGLTTFIGFDRIVDALRVSGDLRPHEGVSKIHVHENG